MPFFPGNLIDIENGRLCKPKPLHFIKPWTGVTYQSNACSRGWAVLRWAEERKGCHRTLIRPRSRSVDPLVKAFTPGLFIWVAKRFAFYRSKDFHIPLKMQFRLRHSRWNISYSFFSLSNELRCVQTRKTTLQFIIVTAHWRRSEEFCLTFVSAHYSTMKIYLNTKPYTDTSTYNKILS